MSLEQKHLHREVKTSRPALSCSATPGTLRYMTYDLLVLALRLFSGCLVLLSAFAPRRASAQTPGAAPPARKPLPFAPQPTPHKSPRHDLYYPYAGVFCGAGSSTSFLATKPTFGCGAGFSFIPLPFPLYTEVGVMGPQAHRSNVSGYVSLDTSLPLARTTGPLLPEVLFGYSRLFETGHAFDYGVALVVPRSGDHQTDLRFELRDYWTFANPDQHNVMLRVGLISYETD